MDIFLTARSLTEMIEKSREKPIIIFKYSSQCKSSGRLAELLSKKVKQKKTPPPIYMVVVQDQPTLSKNITEMFDIDHESPQIIILNHGKVSYTAHHGKIKVEDFI